MVSLRFLDGSKTAEFNDKDNWVSARFSPSGKLLAIGTNDDKVRYFKNPLEGDAALIGEQEGKFHQEGGRIHSCWCPDNKNGDFNLVKLNNKVMVYKVTQEGVTLDSELEHDGDICDFTFCHHGKFLLVGTNKDTYSVWMFAERKKIKDIEGVAFSSQHHTNFRATFAPDNHAVALMGDDGKKCFIYDTA